jgi:hypothetical protein
MTKQHFIALADNIRAHREDYPLIAILHLANFLMTQNPRFNRQRWLDYIAGECGQNGGKVKHAA